MTYQAIRRYYEEPVEAVAAALSIPMRYANQLESGGDAYTEYITARLQFGNMVQSTICGPMEMIRGSFIVEYFGPKGIGAGRAQEVFERVGFALCQQVETRPHDIVTGPPTALLKYSVMGDILELNGPRFAALDDRPYYFGSLSAGILANVSEGTATTVTSLHTRIGDVVAEEGDYKIDQMGDVDTSRPAAPGEFMSWDGSNWVPTPTIDPERY